MKKIPVRQQPPDLPPPPSQSEPPPGYLPDALQTLLLGGIWWFVLIWLPLLQADGVASALVASAPLLFKVEGVVTALIALVLIGLRMAAGVTIWRETSLLSGIAVCGVAMAFWSARPDAFALDGLVYPAALQGILALACFLIRRPLNSSSAK